MGEQPTEKELLMRKRVAAVSLAAGLAGGAIAGIALTHPSVSGAQTDTTTATTAPAPNGQAPPDKSTWIQDALAPLVANGTISQSQADAVANALEAAKPEMHRGPGGPVARASGTGLSSTLRPPRSASPPTTSGPRCSPANRSPRSPRRTGRRRKTSSTRSWPPRRASSPIA